jgi:hypothetical protein
MDIILIGLVVLGLCLFGWLVVSAIFRMVALADKAHPLAWIPLMGLLATASFTIGL